MLIRNVPYRTGVSNLLIITDPLKTIERSDEHIFFIICVCKSVTVAWSVESLPSNPAGSGILISVLGLSMCPLSVFCPVLPLAVALAFC